MNRVNFVELPAGDIAASKKFYQDSFGWEMADYGPTYSCTLNGTVDVGLQGDPPAAAAAPLAVIASDDLVAALARVLAAGGRLVKPIFAFPGGRRFHFLDPHGNELAVWQTDAVD